MRLRWSCPVQSLAVVIFPYDFAFLKSQAIREEISLALIDKIVERHVTLGELLEGQTPRIVNGAMVYSLSARPAGS